MFHSRPTQRRNFLLNMLSIIGAYWVISTLLSFNHIDRRESLEDSVVLNANAAPKEKSNVKEEPRIRARRNQEPGTLDSIRERNIIRVQATAVDTVKEVSVDNGLNDNEKPNIPEPRRLVYNENSPIYRRGDPKQAGEFGAAVKIDKEKLPPSERKKYDEGFKRNSFNEYASEMISLHRSLPNNTDEMCKNKSYNENLPDASVIICFHNEAWSALLRTVHSVLDRTPQKLLTEIILVDDFSDMDHLKKPLEDYLSQFGKVRIVRMESRMGLIRARLKGASVARGTVLIYLDSHCECMEGKFL
uniref:Polypeptide N-acetylgalactosaminyltransferase n=1 Tax=Parascaris univalens TaxID=6257 RepID=A0A915BKU5_PARUN